MAGSVNKVILIGNVGADPEIRQSADGRKIVNMRLATSENWKDKSGVRQEKTEWHSIAIFNQNLADIAERFVKKGSKIYVEGALQTRKWTDKNGQDRYSTEVVLSAFRGELMLLDGKGGMAGDSFASASAPFDAPSASAGWDSKPAAAPAAPGGLDDEIPF